MSKQIHTYYANCVDCGKSKQSNRYQRCLDCGYQKMAAAARRNVYYDSCQTCGEHKPRNRRPNCKRCGGIASAITAGFTPRVDFEYRHSAEYHTLDPVEAVRRQREAHQCARMLRARIAARFRPGVPMNRASLREMFAPDRDEREAA